MKEHAYSTVELGMRVVLLLANEWRHEVSLLELRHRVVMEFGVSRATAYRILSTAIDVLGIAKDRPLEHFSTTALLRRRGASAAPMRLRRVELQAPR